MSYSKEQIASITEGLTKEVEQIECIKSKDMNPQSLSRIATDAETLAVHAAHADMHFTATSLLAIASKMNRYLTLRMAL